MLISDKYYQGRLVENKRTYVINKNLYCVIVEKYTRVEHTVLVEELKENPEEVERVIVTKDSYMNGFDYPSMEFKEFVEQNKLNMNAVVNCLKGLQQTHKGFKFAIINE